MKLNTETLKLLKSFCKINPSIWIQEGSVIRTIDPGESMVASATVKDEFPKSFAIYDLPNWLSVIEMFEGANIDFGDDEQNYCTISYEGQDTADVLFMYTSKGAVDAIEKDLVMPKTEINFILQKEVIEKLMKAAETMSLNHVVVSPGGEENVILTVTDIDSNSSNKYSVKVPAELEIDDFYVIFDFDKFGSLIKTEYNVGITSQRLSHFVGEDVQYWVGLNANTKF